MMRKAETLSLCFKTARVGMAAIYFFTSLSAGASYAWGDALDFLFSNQTRGSDRLQSSGYNSPQALKERLSYKERLSRSQTEAEQQIDRQKSKVLDKITNTLNRDVQKNLQNAEDLSAQAQEARNKTFAILGQNSLFNYVHYEDGKVIWMQDGLAKKIENERILDANGNVSIRTTYDMNYNSKRLLTDYESDTKDPLNNITHVEWRAGAYTADSVYYATEQTSARQLITDYVQETTDDFGNVSKVTWSGGVYDGRLLTGYHQVSVDARGNSSSKDWMEAQYDENRQIRGFKEIETDVHGNTRTRIWSGGTYIKNPSFRDDLKKQGISQSAPEYLLTGYHEDMTDESGLKTSRDFLDASYDSFGQLTRYRELTTDSLGRQTTLDWNDGAYDTYGRLMNYRQISTDLAGNETRTEWKAEGYSNRNRLLGYRETTVDILGLTTELARTHIVYEAIGDLKSYVDTLKDPHGNISIKTRADQAYDPFGRLASYKEESVDPLGVVTSRVWNKGSYDRKNRLTDYHEELTDPFLNVSQRDWRAKYDLRGLLDSYEQFDIDSFGHVTRKDWRASRYDSFDRIVQYEQTVTDPDDNSVKTLWESGNASGEGYNRQGQTLAFEEKVTDIYGQTSRRAFSGGDYDAFGNLRSFQEVLVDPSGADIIHLWKDGSYDVLNRLIRFEESWAAKDSLGQFQLAQTHEWIAGEYDIYGRITNFSEKYISSFGDISSHAQTHTVYDKQSRKVSYLSESIGTDGIATLTSRLTSNYDSRGRETDYFETSSNVREPGITVTKSVAGKTYDRLGQITSGTEMTLTRGTDALGFLINARTVQTVQDAVLRQGNLVSYSQRAVTDGTGPGGVNLDMTVTETVIDLAPFSETRVVRRQARGLDHRITTERSGILRNIFGQIVAYKDKVDDQAFPGGSLFSERTQTIYGGDGQVLSYREKSTDIQGVVSEKMVYGMLYNGAKQILNFTEVQNRDSQKEITHRLSTNYDVLGRMDKYSQVQDSIHSKTTQTTHWRALEFDSAGLVSADDSQTLYESYGLFAPGYTIKTQRSNIVYNLVEQTLGYDSIAHDSRTPDLITNKAITGLAYDSFGVIAAHNETSRLSGKTTQKLPDPSDLNSSMLTGSILLFAGTEVPWDSLSPSEMADLLLGKTVTQNLSAGIIEMSLAPGQASVLVITLDLVTKTVRDQAHFDSKGRLSGYREEVVTSGHALNKTETRIRSNILYIAKGRVSAYDDLISASDQPSILTRISRKGMEYNENGLVTEYREDSTEEEDGVILKSFNSYRSKILYNTLDQVLGYHEDVQGTGIVGTRSIDRTQMEYDANWQISHYLEKVTDSDGYSAETEARDILYNALGQEISRGETITVTAVDAAGTEIHRVVTKR